MGLVILTGASGSGKTAIAEAIARQNAMGVAVHHFDSIDVPSTDAMIRNHGSGEAWQRGATIEWLARIAPQVKSGCAVLFEGQMRISFIVEAAAAADIGSYTLLLIDCDDEARADRLIVERGQPELANKDMMNWASYLRSEAAHHGCEIVDTGRRTLGQSVALVLEYLRKLKP
ncbi:hypothetical protein [Rhizobium sp. BR 314]|uniref:hypothetical protein n=1 Tax=Rhizobium sp. BR 314 TaxID=3040013 RepID=UPI0039BFEAEE